MTFIKGKCTNCGSDIKIKENKKNGFCEHCRAEYITEDIVQNYNTTNKYKKNKNIIKNIYADEVLDIDGLIQKGDAFCSLEVFSQAEKNYMKAINTDSTDYRGWLGMVKTKTQNFTNWKDKSYLKYLEKAKEVANEEQLQEIENQCKKFNAKYKKFKKYKDLQNEKFKEEELRLKQEKQAQFEKDKKEYEISEQKELRDKKIKGIVLSVLLGLVSSLVLLKIIFLLVWLINIKKPKSNLI